MMLLLLLLMMLMMTTMMMVMTMTTMMMVEWSRWINVVFTPVTMTTDKGRFDVNRGLFLTAHCVIPTFPRMEECGPDIFELLSVVSVRFCCAVWTIMKLWRGDGASLDQIKRQVSVVVRCNPKTWKTLGSDRFRDDQSNIGLSSAWILTSMHQKYNSITPLLNMSEKISSWSRVSEPYERISSWSRVSEPYEKIHGRHMKAIVR